MDDVLGEFERQPGGREARSVRHGETPCPLRFLKPVLCEGLCPFVENSVERSQSKREQHPNKMPIHLVISVFHLSRDS